MQPGLKNSKSIFKNNDFLQCLRKMGYSQDVNGFKRCIIAKIGDNSLYALSTKLGISDWAVKQWMKRFGIKNPRKPGDALSRRVNCNNKGNAAWQALGTKEQ